MRTQSPTLNPGPPTFSGWSRALRQVGRQTKEKICYLISGDLAHIGPKFGDEGPLTKSLLAHSREQDLALVRAAEAVNTSRYFRILVKEKDRRRICGFPPTWTLLEACGRDRTDGCWSGGLFVWSILSGASLRQAMQSIVDHLILGTMLLICLAIVVSNAGSHQGE